MAVMLTRANLRTLEKKHHQYPDEDSVGERSLSSLSSARHFDYHNTKPLPGYQVPTVYNHFQSPNESKNHDSNNNHSNQPTQSSNNTKLEQSVASRGGRKVKLLPHGGQLPSLSNSISPTKVSLMGSTSSPGLTQPWQRPARPNDPVEDCNRYEDVNITLDSHHRSRLVQNVTTYIRFFCGQVNHVYSLSDIEDLIANPVYLPQDLIEQNRHIWELIEYMVICCKAAKIKVVQWFDILTQWKAKFQRSLSYSEFAVGLTRLFDEVNAQPFTEQEIQRLFWYFQRCPQKYTSSSSSTQSDSSSVIASILSANPTLCIRRRDFQVGLKKMSLTKKRLEWFNHQAHILFKCQNFLAKIKLSFRDLNVEIVKSKNKKQTINVMELESMVSVLINDYIVFVNCKHVDNLLAKEEKQKQKKDKAAERQKLFEKEMRRLNEEKLKTRRTLDGSEGMIEIYDDSEDDESVVTFTSLDKDDTADVKSVTSQLDIGDDMSTVSLMDDMSDASNMSARSASRQTNTLRSLNTKLTNSSIVATNSKPLQHCMSVEDLRIDPGENKSLTPAEIEHVKRLAAGLRYGNNPLEKDGIRLSVINEENMASISNDSALRSRSIDNHESFMEERQKKSSALVRSHSILRRYSSLVSSSSDGHDDSADSSQAGLGGGGLMASPTLSIPSNGNLNKKLSSSNLTANGNGTSNSIFPARSHNGKSSIIPQEVINDWYLKDEEFKKAQEQDPTLTPSAYQDEYKAFENLMKDKRNKQMQYYKAVTDHFDARVQQARKRLARARKTGI